ncbi:hypothetical protein EYC84_001232 [Monilinia fructicola]|uniref:Uncharacterized protein n=1 Tax=Monilinia fructicola TaxID=38448 RepID=A0A5M9JML0_MONFR|nr:hypothetical protein EYC84_001232 [Monilinia fructicola]
MKDQYPLFNGFDITVAKYRATKNFNYSTSVIKLSIPRPKTPIPFAQSSISYTQQSMPLADPMCNCSNPKNKIKTWIYSRNRIVNTILLKKKTLPTTS